MVSFDPTKYPTLHTRIEWGSIRARFHLSNTFDEALVSNVSIIPYSGDKYIVIQLEGGMWELPGGTINKQETYMDGLRREVMEELGGELRSYTIFGHFVCESTAKEPYRPHIPHPTFIRIVGYGEVELTGEPLNPADGEQVMAVEAVDIGEAIRRFMSVNRPDIAELYKLAHALRTSGKTFSTLDP